MIQLKKAGPHDLSLIEDLEQKCFPGYQISSRRSLRHSLISPYQGVFIAQLKKKAVGMIVYHYHIKTLRVFSVAILPEYQSMGFGSQLMDHTRKMALGKGYVKISLEADATNQKLVDFYEKLGYRISDVFNDYYAVHKPAVRMILQLGQPTKQTKLNIIVTDNPNKWNLEIENLRIVSTQEYLSSEEFQSVKNLRVFNLSNSYRYQSAGYYVSLLASAREHRAIPNVTTIRDFRNVSLIRTIASDIDELMQIELNRVKENNLTIQIYFGQTINRSFKNIGQKLYNLFEAPLLSVQFLRNDRWIIQKVTPLGIDKIPADEWMQIQKFARDYFSKKRFSRPRFQHYKYDLAILVNPNEANAPSCPDALEKFKKAAKKIGFYTELITKDDFDRLSEFDALFIRETTSVNNYTYHFSRTAYAEGLVVIDDPWSILRCSNKIYLNEKLQQNKINTPQSLVLIKGKTKPKLFSTLNYPLVLKQPDSAFSLGVTKVKNSQEMETSVKQLFKKSDLIIAQEFLASDFDWRIGVLDQKPLYACKYFMAENHWQIVNWEGNQDDNFGNVETVPIEKVPESIMKTAVKAASLIGDGLYGVDLKLVNNKPYVIEVNDNPNIDSGYEDAVLKDELYLKVIQSIYNRIEMSRNISRFISVE